jgi:hypothetical protein
MERHAVKKKKKNGKMTTSHTFEYNGCSLRFQSLKALSDFRIPKRKMDDQQGSTTTFNTTTPGASANNDPVPELLKRARAMRFEGRLDKGGIGQQLVLAGFHQLPLEEKLRLAAELDEAEAQVAPEAPQEQLDALVKIFEKPYAKWGPAYANGLLTMFPKPGNSPVGPAPRFK